MTEMVIGGPVRDRAWILNSEYWFKYVGAACDEVGIKPEFVFSLSRHDLDTQDAIIEGAASLHCVADLIYTEEPLRSDIRDWRESRYKEMCVVRNLVLSRVQQIMPQVFWSLDSDILPAPDALVKALPQLERFDAVGMRAYMTPMGIDCPSYAMLSRNALVGRTDAREGTFRVDVVMASILMSPAAYQTPYVTDCQGEDTGWSKGCTAAGLKLGWCAEAVGKHVMHRKALDSIDSRVGF